MPPGSRTRGLVPGVRRRLPIEGPAPLPGAGRSPLNRAARLMLIGAISALAVTMSLVTPGHQRDVAALGARYLVLAQSLTEGHYGLASSPLEEAEVSVPPLWPVALAVAYTIAAPARLADFVPVAQVLTLALLLILLCVLFLYLEQRLDGPTAAAVTILFAVQPWIIPFGRNAMPDAAFMLLMAAALWAGGSALRRSDPRLLFTALALALAATYVRLAGIAILLVLARAAWSVFPRHRAELLLAIVGALLWPIRQLVVVGLGAPTTTTLAESFRVGLGDGSYLEAVATNLVFYPQALVAAVFPTDLLGEPAVQGTLLVALWALIAAGLVADRRHDRGLAGMVFLALLVGLLLWPLHQTRYVVPLLFLALAFAAMGLRELADLVARAVGLLHSRSATRLAPLLLLVLLVPYVRWDLRRVDEADRPGTVTSAQSWDGFYRGLTWIGDRAPGDAMVVTRFPEAAYVMTGRPALTPARLQEVPARRWMGEVWVVRDTFEHAGDDFPISEAALREVGGRIAFIDRASGVEVWLLPGAVRLI